MENLRLTVIAHEVKKQDKHADNTEGILHSR
ncbi:hypothetical protein KCQ_11735 [Pectobacterium atrosepticum ICMP 1526]|nr:hypothetical protein KCQ_11735 [Pectobacterium atrosepticum ICMP 1526]